MSIWETPSEHQGLNTFLKHGLRSFTSPELIPHNDSILLSKSGMKDKPNVNAFKSNGKANSYQLDNFRVARWYFFQFYSILNGKVYK